ncbi:MAG: peptidoglycan binding domain-containing protein, partial [Candidatus Limnocylindrales bacterium]
MTTTTPDTVALPAHVGRRPSGRLRFAVAFLVGLLVALGAGVGALYAYDQQYVGRILPGVRVGTINLSGLDPVAAAERLNAEYGGLRDGEIVLAGPDGPITIPYAAVGRRADVEGMLADAMAVGRAGSPVERVIADARTALRGVTIAPRVTFDQERVADRIGGALGLLSIDPVDASVAVAADTTFVFVPGHAGRRADATPAITATLAALGDLDAPARLELDVPVTILVPTVTTVEAFNAKALAERLTNRITLEVEDVKDPQFISSKRLRGWTSFAVTPDGGYAPTLDTSDLSAALAKLAKKVDRRPVNASFKTKGGRITGVTSSRNGYKMDVAATAAAVQAVLAGRMAGAVAPTVEPTLKVTKPVLTTAE